MYPPSKSRIREMWPVFTYALLIGGLYVSTARYLLKIWQREDFNYCFLIPFIICYLIWEKRHDLAQTENRPSWAGLGVLLAGMLLFWVGELAGEYYTQYLSFWLLLVGLAWMHWGWHKLKRISFPLVLTFAMFPPPYFVNNKLTFYLKTVSSKFGVAFIKLGGLSAYREGNLIDLGFTKLQVVDACSGLRYLFPLMILGALLAYFYKAPRWKRVLLFCSTIPISIGVNSLRIASVGILYRFFGPAVAEGFFHDFSGWLVFMASIGILLFEVWLLKKAGGDPAPESGGRPATQVPNPGPSRSSAGLPAQFAAAVVILVATLGLAQGIEFRETIPIKKPLSRFPLQIGTWEGIRMNLEETYLAELDLSDYLLADYRNGDREQVHFYIAYYASQQKGQSIHTPETCLPGGGWVFQKAGRERLVVTAAAGERSLNISRVVMQKGDERHLMYYFFWQRGRTLTDIYQLKLFTLWDALTRQRTDGALVRLITPVGPRERFEAAEMRLNSFAQKALPLLGDYIPT